MSKSVPPQRRLLVIVAAMVAIVVSIWLLAKIGSGKPIFRLFDFVEYHAAARLLLSGNNPYDAESLLPLQVEAAQEDRELALMMWNPPWIFPLILPLGMTTPAIGQILLFTSSLMCVLFCADWLWLAFGGNPEHRWIGWVTAIGFAPTLFVLMMGQISAFLLLGFVGFTVGLRANRPILAGLAAALTALKPHLFAVFVVLFFLESCRSRRTRLAVASGIVAIAISSIVPLIWCPDVWQHFRSAASRTTGAAHVSTADWHQPTIGYHLRQLLPDSPFWVQFVPVALAAALAPLYWWPRRTKWDWVAEAPRLSFAIILTACYGAWAFDLVLLLPGVLWAAVRVANSSSQIAKIGIGVLYITFNVLVASTINRPLSQDNPWIAPIVLFGVASTALIKAPHLSSKISSTSNCTSPVQP